jgi:hypothetical protein
MTRAWRCAFPSELIQARVAPEKIDSLADDVKPLVLELLRQISGLTARVDELVAQNKRFGATGRLRTLPNLSPAAVTRAAAKRIASGRRELFLPKKRFAVGDPHLCPDGKLGRRGAAAADLMEARFQQS